jgi:hypothetical protein
MRFRKPKLKPKSKPKKRRYVTLELSPSMERYVRQRAKSFKTLNSYFRYLIAMDQQGKMPWQSPVIAERQTITYQREVSVPAVLDPPRASEPKPKLYEQQAAPLSGMMSEIKESPIFQAQKAKHVQA